MRRFSSLQIDKTARRFQLVVITSQYLNRISANDILFVASVENCDESGNEASLFFYANVRDRFSFKYSSFLALLR